MTCINVTIMPMVKYNKREQLFGIKKLQCQWKTCERSEKLEASINYHQQDLRKWELPSD